MLMNMRTASADGAGAVPLRAVQLGRMEAAVTPLLIVGDRALNYIPSVLFALDMGVDAATVALIVVFTLLGLMIVAWSFTCATDPRAAGAVAAADDAGGGGRRCRGSALSRAVAAACTTAR